MVKSTGYEHDKPYAGQPERNDSARAPHVEQLLLFPTSAPPWASLTTKALSLDASTYEAIRESYREVFETYLPGPGVTPLYTQVAYELQSRGFNISPYQLASLVRRARRLALKDFPDPRKRSVAASSAEARRLRAPHAPVYMSPEEHNAFAKIYRDLLTEGYPKKKLGKGFFQEAETRMNREGYNFGRQKLNQYASYRRRIGDLNFPRLRGSHELDRIHVAAVDRIQALGVMATGLMHEILQPLQIILGDAEIERRKAQSNEIDPVTLAARMDGIIAQVRKLSEVVKHVRTIARAGEIKVGPVTLKDVVESSLSLFLSQLRGGGIQVDTSGVGERLPPIAADAVGVERIFINLVTNARDAIDETGRGEGAIRISAHAEGSYVICEVSDNGIGIVEGNLSRVFDPYFTTKEVGKGTGMGLSEVMNLMIQFGGRVKVSSTPNQSTTFRLEFTQHAIDS